nr:MAG TPA: hypothetical protein [Caudoviricetes sp.]
MQTDYFFCHIRYFPAKTWNIWNKYKINKMLG